MLSQSSQPNTRGPDVQWQCLSSFYSDGQQSGSIPGQPGPAFTVTIYDNQDIQAWRAVDCSSAEPSQFHFLRETHQGVKYNNNIEYTGNDGTLSDPTNYNNDDDVTHYFTLLYTSPNYSTLL